MASGAPEDPAGLALPEDGVDDVNYAVNPEDYEPPEDAAENAAGEPPPNPGPTAAEEIERAGVALLDLLLADEGAWGVYEKQCQQGLVGMFGRAKTLRFALEERGEIHDQGAVEAAITESALDTHPESVAAAWERLHSPERVRREYAVNIRDGAVAAVVDAASKEAWLFKEMTHLALAADGPDEEHLLAVSRQAYAALRRRGMRFKPGGFSGHVWRALLEVFPSAPGVRWDDAWADGLLLRAVVYVGERAAPSSYVGWGGDRDAYADGRRAGRGAPLSRPPPLPARRARLGGGRLGRESCRHPDARRRGRRLR